MELTYVNVGLISKLLVFSILGFAAVSSRAWLERTLLNFHSTSLVLQRTTCMPVL